MNIDVCVSVSVCVRLVALFSPRRSVRGFRAGLGVVQLGLPLTEEIERYRKERRKKKEYIYYACCSQSLNMFFLGGRRVR